MPIIDRNDPASWPVGEDHSFDLVTAISRYEEGELGEEEMLELFQHLVDTGLAWSLQGSYGREAARLIDAGLVSEDPRRHKPR